MCPQLSRAAKMRVAELFAGVGGFGLGLEQSGEWEVVWANQWEPSTKKQHAFNCLQRHFGSRAETVCEDIVKVLDGVELGQIEIPAHDLVVGGFPCQDYSVATTQAEGIVGRKGVLWWQIYRFLRHFNPAYAVFENVDRLLKSPANNRGRDFAIILSCLAQLGYLAEWRVINAADYGFPQKRRRVFIVAISERKSLELIKPFEWLTERGVLARAFPVQIPEQDLYTVNAPFDFSIPTDPVDTSQSFEVRRKSPFLNSGVMRRGCILTRPLDPRYVGPRTALGDCLVPESQVDEEYFVPETQLAVWKYLKGAKHEVRRHRDTGATYTYDEGPIPFPDSIHGPARTILTAEGGRSPSRFKHIINAANGRYRRLTPVELERLNGFPDDWTAGLTDGRRAFCMGNALVVGVIERIGRALAQVAREMDEHESHSWTSSGRNLGGSLTLHERQPGEEYQAGTAAKG